MRFYKSHFSRDLNKNYQSCSIRELQETITDIIKDIRAAPTPNENARSMEFRISQDLEEIYEKLPSREQTVQGDILKFVPEILFYRQEDKLPDQISLDGSSGNQDTFVNLLKLSGIDKVETYTDKKTREQFRIQSIIQDEIRVDLNEYWEQKQVSIEIKDNEEDLAIFLRDVEKDGTKVEREPESPSQRSRGFNWFLSFYINFKAVSDTEDDAIILLDDPAVYLHPKGKQNWVEAMEEISRDNQVIYTAHSPYSIDRRHPNRVRLVKDKGKSKAEVTSNPGNAGELTLEPLRSALGIKLGDSPFVNRKNLLVEGETDFHIIRGVINHFQKYRDDIDFPPLTVISCSGSNIYQYAEWLLSEGFEIKVLLDNDDGGDTHYNKLKSEISGIEDEDISRVTEKVEGEIENVFAPEFYAQQLNEVLNQKFKTGYDELEVHTDEESTRIDGVEIEDQRFMEDLEVLLNKRGLRLDRSTKKLVGEKIREKLESGNLPDSEEKSIKELAGKIKNLV